MKGLKIVLWICAIYCFTGIIPAVLPWNTIVALFNWVEIPPPTTEAINVFIFRLGSAIFGLIGTFLVILARNPLKYGVMLLLAAYGLMLFGVLVLIGGIRYELPVLAYFSDVIIGIGGCTLLLYFRKKELGTNIGQGRS